MGQGGQIYQAPGYPDDYDYYNYWTPMEEILRLWYLDVSIKVISTNCVYYETYYF